MAEVIPASGDDWRELMRRASLPEGHVERVLLELQQRLVPVGAAEMAAAAADHFPDAKKMVAPTPAAAPGLPWLSEDDFVKLSIKNGYGPTPGGDRWHECFDLARAAYKRGADDQLEACVLSDPRIGPLLRGKWVVLPEVPISGIAGMAKRQSRDPREWLAGWAAARAEVARQQGEQP